MRLYGTNAGFIKVALTLKQRSTQLRWYVTVRLVQVVVMLNTFDENNTAD